MTLDSHPVHIAPGSSSMPLDCEGIMKAAWGAGEGASAPDAPALAGFGRGWWGGEMKLLLATLVCWILQQPVLASPVVVGGPAPVGRGSSHTGDVVDLAAAYRSGGHVLVYFYPKADTPGCTAQACSLRDAYAELLKRGVTVFGVSTDGADALQAFRTKYRLPFTLVSDPKGEIAAAFDVPLSKGMAARQAFLVKGGKVVWLDRQASTKEQAADVLKVVGG